MKTYQALKAEIAKLEKKAEALRRNELKSVIAQVKKTIAEFGLTAAELGLGSGAPKAALRRRAVAKRAATVGVARYRDPKTGDTWTGRGRPPAWIAKAKDREAFLIAAAAAAPAAEAPQAAKVPKQARAAAKRAKPAKRAAKRVAKAAAKPAAKPAPKARRAAAKARKPRAAEQTGAVQIESGVASQ